MLSGIRLRRCPRPRAVRAGRFIVSRGWGKVCVICQVEKPRPGAVRAGRFIVWRGWCKVVVICQVEKPRAGLISGGSTPICCAADKLGEAPFKDFWSDDTKKNYKEEKE